MLNFYETLAHPFLRYGCGIWTQPDKNMLRAEGTKFLREIAAYAIFDHRSTEEIL